MAADRFVVAGLARARTAWFRTVASWAHSGAIPADFVGCVSAEELRAHVEGGRAFSAALLDSGLPSVDRDLVALLRDAGVAPLFVDAPGVRREWRELGGAATLPSEFSREQLLDVLRSTSAPLRSGDIPGAPHVDAASVADVPLAPLVSVCGPGGTGASTVAIALAQGLVAASAPRRSRVRRKAAATSSDAARPVLLADLCLRADQAMLHDARDIVPGVQEVVEAYRNRRLDEHEVRAMTFRVVERGYSLLLGLRRPLNWTAIRPRAFDAALRGLRESFSYVVADVEADLESESDSGSIDIEERNVMARATVASSSVVLVVGRGGLSGLAGLVRTVSELLASDVAAERILPVCTPAPRSPARRAEFTRAFADLLALRTENVTMPGILFLPRRRLDDALRDGLAIPKPLPDMVARAVLNLIDDADAAPPASAEPEVVHPGSLGLSGH